MPSMTRLLAVALMLCTTGCPPASQRRQKHPKCKDPVVQQCVQPHFDVVDLTHPIHEQMPVWPGGVPFKMTRLVDYDEGYRLHKFEVGENTGTHVDAPSHFIEGSRGIDQLAVDELVVAAAVIDIKDKVKSNPDYQLNGNDLVDWEAVHGPVPVGSLVIANTGWHTRFVDQKQYANQDAQGVMHYPGFAPETAKLLLDRDVAGAGIDTLSLDHGKTKDFAFHKEMLGAGKYLIENLANLDALPETGATVVIGVLPVTDGTQAQARIIALVPEKSETDDEQEQGL